MFQNPWDNDPVIKPPSASPFGARPVIREGAPMPAPRNPQQIQNDRLDNELKQYQIQEMRDKRAEQRRKIEEAKMLRQGAATEIVNVIDKAYAAKEKSNEWFATGFGAGLVKNIGGTPAADVDGLLDTIGANTAFEKLQKIRDASPTGGALGAISERELDLLKGSISSLKQSQSDEQFKQSMQNIAESYGRVLMKLPGGREIMKQRGWIGRKPQRQPQRQQRPRIIDFNSLPE